MRIGAEVIPGGTDTVRASEIYAKPPADAPSLRIGLLLGGRAQGLWLARIIEEIETSGIGEIAVVILAAAISGRAGGGCARSKAPLPERLYEWADRTLFFRRAIGPDLLQAVDISPWIGGIPLVQVAPSAPGSGSPQAEDDGKRIARLGLDIILLLVPDEIAGNLHAATRLGLLAFGSGSPTGGFDFADMAEGAPTMEATLRLLAASPATNRVIGRRTIAADPRSLYRNRQKMAASRIELVLHGLRALRERSEATAMDISRNGGSPAPRLTRGPAAWRATRLLLRTCLAWLASRWTLAQGEWWFLALRPYASTPPAPVALAGDPEGFRPLPCPPGHYQADPFLIEQAGTTHVFFEDFDKTQGKGAVGHVSLAADGTPSSPETVLERPYHLSYPFVFAWNGQIYMLPESGQNRTVELYRSQAFPRGWVLERVLLQGWRAKDPTLHQDQAGRWWLFLAIDERGNGAGEALFLFQAETPLGPWRPHPENPVQSDPRYARPGGRLFRQGSALLRPAQDGSRHYGSGLWFMEIEELTPTRYRERPLRRWGPQWLAGNRCLHHRDATQKWEIIDGMRRHPDA
jgi:hypothetical protein